MPKDIVIKKPVEKMTAVTINKQRVTSATKQANVLLPTDALLGLFPEEEGPVSLGITTDPKSLGADCQPYACKPTAANNCCDYVKQCNPDLHCSNVDWEAYGWDPAPYCKKCSISTSGNSTVCWCSQTPPPQPPRPAADSLTIPPRKPQ